MPNVTLRQRLFLSSFGIFLALVFLEFVLRFGGWLFIVHQDQLNKRILFKNNELRILCLGESTTALGGENSYPYQLQEILQSKRPETRWVVINQGRVSKTSADILRELDKDLARYRPHLVITMIGINDPPLLPRDGSFRSWARKISQKSRVYHLLELLGQHLAYKFKPVQSVPVTEATPVPIVDPDKMTKILQEIEAAIAQLQKQEANDPKAEGRMRQDLAHLRGRQVMILIGLGDYYLSRQEFVQAENLLRLAHMFAPRNYVVLLELARVYKDQNQCVKAIPLLQQAYGISPKTVSSLVELLLCYDALDRPQQAYGIAKKILDEKGDQAWMYDETGNWLAKHGYLAEAEQAYLRAIGCNATDASLYQKLIDIYEREGKKDLALSYQRKMIDRQKAIDTFLPETIENYRQIAGTVLARGIKLVVMQYPLRHIEPLQDIFPKDWPIFFVENQKNFLRALQTGQYVDYFSDNFAGDFGHCRRPGNRLIAEHLATVILQQLGQ